jgi:hypothetical protein
MFWREDTFRFRAGQGPGAAFRLHFRHAKGRYAEAAIGEGRIG